MVSQWDFLYYLTVDYMVIFTYNYRTGARADIPDCHKKCVIHKASYVPDVTYLKAVLANKDKSMSSLEVQNEDGATPLMLACQQEEEDHTKELLDKKVLKTIQYITTYRYMLIQ